MRKDLIPYLRSHRTLVITCLESCLDLEQQGHGNIFRYTSLGNTINHYDPHQIEMLQRFVEFKHCTRIVIAGHYQCQALQYLMKPLRENLANRMSQQLEQLMNDNHTSLLPLHLRDKMLTELNVVNQCKGLLQYAFIRERVDNEGLSIVGIVLTHSGEMKTLWQNGISLNDLISSN